MEECSMVAWGPSQWSFHFKKGKKGSTEGSSTVRPVPSGSPEPCAWGRGPSWLGIQPPSPALFSFPGEYVLMLESSRCRGRELTLPFWMP